MSQKCENCGAEVDGGCCSMSPKCISCMDCTCPDCYRCKL